MAATQDEIDQQERVIIEAQQIVRQFLNDITALNAHAATYVRLGLGDDQILDDIALANVHTTRTKYRAAMTTIEFVQNLLAAGHGTNLEQFAR